MKGFPRHFPAMIHQYTNKISFEERDLINFLEDALSSSSKYLLKRLLNYIYGLLAINLIV